MELNLTSSYSPTGIYLCSMLDSRYYYRKYYYFGYNAESRVPTGKKICSISQDATSFDFDQPDNFTTALQLTNQVIEVVFGCDKLDVCCDTKCCSKWNPYFWIVTTLGSVFLFVGLVYLVVLFSIQLDIALTARKSKRLKSLSFLASGTNTGVKKTSTSSFTIEPE